MKSEYTEVWTKNGVEVPTSEKTIILPFKRASARALIVRKRDGAILGTLHNINGDYALPGGGFENGETSAEAVLRELDEENIVLINKDPSWKSDIVVDYYGGYSELSVWHLFVVDDAEFGECEENIESRWISQDEDVWHPYLKEKIILAICRLQPDLSKKTLTID